ncbi:MAG: DNA methyltransferase [Candidatus Moranbacteria bacterium]|nr:DNA methyltransferase [Candidatus Moranbacteria bacterium]
MSKEQLVWSTEKRKVDDLMPYEKNPRKISDKQIADLKKSLKKYNLVEIPAVTLDGKIISGHQRIKVLQLLGRGSEEIDVRVPNRELTQEEFEGYLLTSNAVTADWDFEKLQCFDMDLLLSIGFGEDELMHIFDENAETEDDNFDEEKELKEIESTDIKEGDMFSLGSHKLICGNSHNPEVIKKLMGDEKASMVANDPIYNIGVSYDKGIGGKQNYGGKVNDVKTDEEYKEFLKLGMESSMAVTKNDCHYFYWCDQKYIGLVQELYHELSVENKRVCMWLKNSQNPTPNIAFSKCYEPCVYGTVGKPYLSKNSQSLNEIMNKEITTGNRLIDDVMDMFDIWLVKRLAGNEYEHPTSKPPTLYEKAIRRCTRPGEIILDIYGGSGSTLLAGEMLKRKVYTCEIEPIFCQLIINRYEKYANKKAKKLN